MKAKLFRARAFEKSRLSAEDQKRARLPKNADLDPARFQRLRHSRRPTHLEDRDFGFFNSGFFERAADEGIARRTILRDADGLPSYIVKRLHGRIGFEQNPLRRIPRQR